MVRDNLQAQAICTAHFYTQYVDQYMLESLDALLRINLRTSVVNKFGDTTNMRLQILLNRKGPL